jgi:hypothetical protein
VKDIGHLMNGGDSAPLAEIADASTLSGAKRILASLNKPAYCDITRAGGAKKTICAVFTDGSRDNLMFGRNGVFYDRAGVDWDATITKVIDNPIIIREAFWSPLRSPQRRSRLRATAHH